MPTFKLSANVTVSAYTTVEAPSLEDAIKLAEDREVVIGGANSGKTEEENWIIDDADGTAQNIHVSD